MPQLPHRSQSRPPSQPEHLGQATGLSPEPPQLAQSVGSAWATALVLASSLLISVQRAPQSCRGPLVAPAVACLQVRKPVEIEHRSAPSAERVVRSERRLRGVAMVTIQDFSDAESLAR